METTIIVNGMACEHCVKRVTKAAMGIANVNSVAIDLSTKKVVIDHNDADIAAIKAAINELGFEAE